MVMLEHFTIDTSVNISMIFALFACLFGAGRVAQKILTSLKMIEKIAPAFERMESRLTILENHLGFSDRPFHSVVHNKEQEELF